MSKHYGQILERAIRRNGNSISEVARLLNMNRRSVYNWFNQVQLRPEILYKIGHVINYDFSVDLPNLFTPEDFIKKPRLAVNKEGELMEDTTNSNSWQQKYIDLLEKYNSLLSEIVVSDQLTKP
jgi:transcriptional regulator with XRE-family HTH domain